MMASSNQTVPTQGLPATSKSSSSTAPPPGSTGLVDGGVWADKDDPEVWQKIVEVTNDTLLEVARKRVAEEGEVEKLGLKPKIGGCRLGRSVTCRPTPPKKIKDRKSRPKSGVKKTTKIADDIRVTWQLLVVFWLPKNAPKMLPIFGPLWHRFRGSNLIHLRCLEFLWNNNVRWVKWSRSRSTIAFPADFPSMNRCEHLRCSKFTESGATRTIDEPTPWFRLIGHFPRTANVS